jgi:urease accessory protein
LEAIPAVHDDFNSGWFARLELEVRCREARVELARRVHEGPLRIQKPFYPEGSRLPHLYLLHPPGGMVGGDRLELTIEVGPSAAALITTPAAQKLYRSRGPQSAQNVRLSVGEGGALEWLPAETLVFDGANAKLSTRVDLDQEAAFVGWEIGCFGRPAPGLPFAHGQFVQSFEIYRGACPLLVERARVAGGSDLLLAPSGYGGATCYGTFYAVPRMSRDLGELVARLRCSALFSEPGRVSVTALDELLVVRALGASIEAVRLAFIEAWSSMRQDLLGRSACIPRIWAT